MFTSNLCNEKPLSPPRTTVGPSVEAYCRVLGRCAFRRARYSCSISKGTGFLAHHNAQTHFLWKCIHAGVLVVIKVLLASNTSHRSDGPNLLGSVLPLGPRGGGLMNLPRLFLVTRPGSSQRDLGLGIIESHEVPSCRMFVNPTGAFNSKS